MTMPCAAVLLASALTASADPVVARIDGEPVRASIVLAREARARALGAELPRARILDAIVSDLLAEREAKRLGVDRAPGIAEGVLAERRRFAAERYATRELEKLEPSEQALRDLYHQGADAFRLKLATFAARAEAEAALARLAKGGDFAEEALRSLDPRSKRKEGDLGRVPRMELDPALAEAAAAAPLGKPHGPVALPLGHAVIVVLERSVGDEAGYAAKAAELRKFARGELQRQAKRHLVAQLRSAAGVKLDEAFLESTGTRLEATPEEAAHVVATVRGRAIRWGEVLPAVRGTVGREGHLSGRAVKAEFAWAEVDRVLLEEEGMRRGFGDGPEAAAAAADARAWLTAQAMGAKVREEVPAPGAAAIERYYAEHAAELARPARRACSDIVLESRADAERAKKRLAAGERFEDVARQLSGDKESAAHGGALGEIPLDRVDALAKAGEEALARALREAKPGEVTGPVFASQGVHLLRCGPIVPTGPAPLAEVRSGIAERVRALEQEAALARKLAALRQAARVEVDEAALAALERARA
jgi:parvulin-like peptidyl-prolyl isomerase